MLEVLGAEDVSAGSREEPFRDQPGVRWRAHSAAGVRRGEVHRGQLREEQEENVRMSGRRRAVTTSLADFIN